MRALLAWVLAACASTNALGQSLPASVQLPTLQVFSVDTTVSVPDRGGMWLGSIGRRSEGRNEFGPRPFASRPGIGVQSAASGLQVRATIMDLDELDRQVLARARNQSLAIAAALEETVDRRVQRAVSKAAAAPAGGPASLAEIRARQAEADQAAHREGEDLLERALAAQDDGKLGAAKVYYQMAARRLTGELQQEALRRLNSLRTKGDARKSAPRDESTRQP